LDGIMTLLADAPASPASVLTRLPVVIIGAGPVGLAAAAQLLERGIEPLVLERGSAPAPRSAPGATPGCSRRGSTSPTPPRCDC
jgi:NADPH-dependent 2,4-dienoyl-CoA reductase/sulfur reductase-like enzyme